MQNWNCNEKNIEVYNRLRKLIPEIFKNNQLKNRLILKGGMGLSCYLEPHDRLFCDINFDHLGTNSKYFIRKQVHKNISEVLRENGYFSDISSEDDYKYYIEKFRYPFIHDNVDLNIGIDINYVNGVPLLKKNSCTYEGVIVNTYKLEELIAMKISALMSRGACKDLLDIFLLINKYPNIDTTIIRKLFIFYQTLSKINGNITDLSFFDKFSSTNMSKHIDGLVYESVDYIYIKNYVLDFLKNLLEFSNDEIEFYTKFYEGEYHPELLFGDSKITNRAKEHCFAKIKQYKINKFRKMHEIN